MPLKGGHPHTETVSQKSVTFSVASGTSAVSGSNPEEGSAEFSVGSYNNYNNSFHSNSYNNSRNGHEGRAARRRSSYDSFMAGPEPEDNKLFCEETACIVWITVCFSMVVGIISTVTAILLLSDENFTGGKNIGNSTDGMDNAMNGTNIPTLKDQYVDLLSTSSTVDDLTRVGSPQARAVDWLVDQDTLHSNTFTDEIDDDDDDNAALLQAIKQRYALVAVLFGLGAPTDSVLLAGVHECEWGSGILCSPDRRVRELYVSNNNNNNYNNNTETGAESQVDPVAIIPELGLLDGIRTFH